ncbi:MAG: hypothetical protein JSS81_29710 [Acidobacteria bacterium]|nr:hypothetical protein [Acidobacteriota bacterium]
MTHSLVLEVPENIYRPLVEEAEAKGRKVEEIALERLAKEEVPGDEDFERLADELADFFEKNLPPDAKPLSDYAMSREGIYEDHP